MRLIDADRLKEVTKRNFYNSSVFRQIIDAQPTIELVKHGCWIEVNQFESRCSECGYTDNKHGFLGKYCQECGTKLDGDNK